MACITTTTSRFASVVPADISISDASNANLFLVDGANIVDVGSNRTVEWRSQCLHNRDDDFVFATNQAPTNVALSGDAVPESSAVTVNGTVHADADAEMHMSHHHQLTANDFLL